MTAQAFHFSDNELDPDHKAVLNKAHLVDIPLIAALSAEAGGMLRHRLGIPAVVGLGQAPMLLLHGRGQLSNCSRSWICEKA